MFFETGMEGCDWAIQDETTIPKDGYWGYEGLHFLRSRKPKIKYLIIFKDGEEVWSGDPEFTSTYMAANSKIKEYLVSHTYETGYTRTQLQFHNYWFHNLPANGDLDIWKDILENEKAYTAEVEFSK